MRGALLAGAATVACAIACLFAATAQAEVVWLCEPGAADNPCEIGQDTTVREAGKPDRVITPPTGRRKVDCFYVYPTVSNQLTPNATKARDPELESIAKYQAARFSTQCRVFAPIYRQGTLAGIVGGVAGGEATFDRELAYGDVLEAWREYLREDNHGRGVVLIGHSQGTFMLRELIAREIEKKRSQRARLVSALLIGGNVQVADGKLKGGDFKRTPLCTEKFQLGCVVAYSSFAEDPPQGARFGSPEGEGLETACTDPRKLAGWNQPLRLLTPSEPFAPGPIQAGIILTSGGSPPTAPTTWVTPADRYEGTCKEINGATVLRYEPKPGSRRPVFFPEPGWGTHLVDMNIELDPLVELVRGQAERWSTNPRVRGTSRCGKRFVRMRVVGRDLDLVRKVVFRVGKRRIDTDRKAPFKAKVRAKRVRKKPVSANVRFDTGYGVEYVTGCG